MAPTLLQDMATPQGSEHHRKICLFRSKKTKKRDRRPGNIDVMPVDIENAAGSPDQKPPRGMHRADCTWQGAHGPRMPTPAMATPTVGLEPTTTRLRALRSAD